jgi:TRAP-type uncharacterized transport system fused permease subunit
MLWINTTWYGIIQTLFTSCIGMTAIGASMIGFFLAKMTWLERGVFFIGGLMLVDPGTMTDLAGILILAIAVFYQWEKKRKETSQQFAGSV